MYEQVFKQVNFNFQLNRVLSFGERGCDREEVLQAMLAVKDNESWYTEWKRIAEKARNESRLLHSMYYYRMAEFMLLPSRPEKMEMYAAMQEMFRDAFPEVVKVNIPYKDQYLSAVRIVSSTATKTLLIHGGFDSFIEELYIVAEEFIDSDVQIILFEGEGQGEPMRQGLYFHEKWEQSVKAILDYYELKDVILMGISWGGYFALRAAAYDKRIQHVICHGVLYDALDVQQQSIKQPARAVFKLLYRLQLKQLINTFARLKSSSDQLTEWALAHGMFVTHTHSPFDFFKSIEKHTLQDELSKITQDVLLLSGEKDHYIPAWQFTHLKDNLLNAYVESRIFTEAEGGEQHCQVGNYEIAIDYMKEWIKRRV
ncbi:alpha/beta hydrolase [Sporosarcina sp. P20a]|uniref:alpha/beta fold hydrolase n=1 Tax=Sporosarcina sp. P20a TaxID=2048256 RepID=UPI000C16B79D|nr:alpha/beta hydrolase [Sporosarcina sp. P20a]PIC87093.1 alpha/beta hydrolase [Sporosarcina sp. P20a]